jgi:hypothetical protein
MTKSKPPSTEYGRRFLETLKNYNPDEGSVAAFKVASALTAAVHAEPDSKWSYDQCVELGERYPGNLTGAAATQIGNLARFHHYIHEDMLPRLKQWRSQGPGAQYPISAHIDEAIENVEFAQSRLK